VEKINLPNYLADQEEADRLWLCGRDALEKAGLNQYEVSNFCREKKESRHNIRYWRMLNWLALGPSASGTVINDETGKGFRYTISPDVDQWLSKGRLEISSTPLRHEELDSLTLIKETFLMGFRYIEGPDVEMFQRRFRRSIIDCIPMTLETWRGRGLLQNNKIALTKEGLLFLNSFLTDAFLELDSSSSELGSSSSELDGTITSC
jgi:oxygen-independent coproporphyrinogen-3 oxidase